MSVRRDHEDVLGQSAWPLMFRLPSRPLPGFAVPQKGEQNVRLWARTLAGMQKEAVVGSTQSGDAWRLASDEGPYLRGFDSAPCPLAFFTAGLVAACMNEIMAMATLRQIEIEDIVLQLDNFYGMTGSAPQRTMTASASAPRLVVRLNSRASDLLLTELIDEAIAVSAACALVTRPLASRFALTVNGSPIISSEESQVAVHEEELADFQGWEPLAGAQNGGAAITRLTEVKTVRGVAGGLATSLAPTQDRGLHIRGTCRRLADGSKEIEQQLFSPLGSSFRFVSDETPEYGSQGRAPDAASYLAAGIGFCFMTQLGRYARILRRDLGEYRIVQDLHLTSGTRDSATQGSCRPVETHLYIDGTVDEGFARELLGMGEQTCFLHALCRTPLKMEVELQRGFDVGMKQ